MCAGAMIQARIARLVYGPDDPKGGAVESCFAILSHPQINHSIEVTSGVLADEAAGLLREFLLPPAARPSRRLNQGAVSPSMW